MAKELSQDQCADPPLTTGQMLARSLAYAQIEMDLVIPPDANTLRGEDPGSGVDKIPLSPGRTLFHPIATPAPYMRCGTAVLQPDEVYWAARNRTLHLQNPVERRLWADTAFSLAAGQDLLWNVNLQTQAEDHFSPVNDDDFTEW